jgi:capsular exopolysaccharide synthesis family protein
VLNGVGAGSLTARSGALPAPAALLRAVRHHWLIALLLGAVASAAAGSLAWWVVPRQKYTAAALLEVHAQRPVLLTSTAQERTELRVFQATQLALVRSRLVLTSALARPGVDELMTVRSQPSPLEWLEDQLSAEFRAGSELMRLALSGDRPDDLSALVSAVADAYLDEVLTKDHTERDEAARKLRSLLNDYNDKLGRQRTDLKKLAESVGSDDRQTLALKQQLTEQHLGQERGELNRVETDLKRSRVELSVLEGATAEATLPPAEAEVDDLLAREPAVEQHRALAANLTDRIEQLRGRLRNENDPSLRELRTKLGLAHKAQRAKIEELRPKVERRLREQSERRAVERISELRTQVQILAEYEKALQESVKRLDREAQSFNRQTIDLQWLKDEITQNEQIARQLGSQIEAINVELKAPRRGGLVEPAAARLESPKKRLAAIALAALGAFTVTVLAVCWREYRVRRVDSPDEMIESVGLRLLGTLPVQPPALRGASARTRAWGAEGSLTTRWQDLLVESVDATRVVLLRECHADDLRAVMITSAFKGEGKSSLASHLAISLARTGRRTALADFDLRNPAAHRLFDLPAGPGVCELLLGEIDIASAARAVASDLDVIPAGRCTGEAVRALGRDALPALINLLKDEYDFVLIDSAPVIPVADSLLISQHADAVLLSVCREVSRLPAIRAGYARLAALGARVLGVVLTGVADDALTETYGDLAVHHY